MVDPQADVDRVANYMGLERRAICQPSAIPLSIQRNEVNEEWRARFLQERVDQNKLDALDLKRPSALPDPLLQMCL